MKVIFVVLLAVMVAYLVGQQWYTTKGSDKK